MSEALQSIVETIDRRLEQLYEEIARLERARGTLNVASAPAPPAAARPKRAAAPAKPASPPRPEAAPSAPSSDSGQDGAEPGDAPGRRLPPAEREAQIVAIVGRRPMIGTSDLAREVGLSPARVSQLTRQLEADGRITRSGSGWLAAARQV